jgi:hypothetical protein
MSVDPKPEAKLRCYEIVEVVAGHRKCEELVGHRGTVLWCNPPFFRRSAGGESQWVYCVYFPAQDRYLSLSESELRATGRFDTEEAHLGRQFEVRAWVERQGPDSLLLK